MPDIDADLADQLFLFASSSLPAKANVLSKYIIPFWGSLYLFTRAKFTNSFEELLTLGTGMETPSKFIVFTLSFLLLTSGCSSKKYDSWSGCMLEENRTARDPVAVSLYCNSNYTPTKKELDVLDGLAGVEKSQSVSGASALGGKPVPLDKLPEEIRASGRPGPWNNYQDKGLESELPQMDTQDAAKEATEAARESTAGKGNN